MTRQELIAAADALPRASSEAAWEYEEKSASLAAKVNQIMSAREDLETLIGPHNRAMMGENHRNHARFIASVLHDFQAEVLVDTILWVYRAYRAHGFRLTYWPAQLDVWLETLREELSPSSFKAVEPLYLFMIIRQPAFVQLSDATEYPEHAGHLCSHVTT